MIHPISFTFYAVPNGPAVGAIKAVWPAHHGFDTDLLYSFWQIPDKLYHRQSKISPAKSFFQRSGLLTNTWASLLTHSP